MPKLVKLLLILATTYLFSHVVADLYSYVPLYQVVANYGFNTFVSKETYEFGFKSVIEFILIPLVSLIYAKILREIALSGQETSKGKTVH